MIRTTRQLRVLAVMRSPELGEALKQEASQFNGVRLEVLNAELALVNEDLLAYHRPNVVVADVDLSDKQDMSRLGGFVQQHGHRFSVIATSPDASIEGMRQLMRLGVADVLRQPIVTADFEAALQAVADRLKQETAVQPKGKILSFVKSTGGVGATTLAIQTACSLVDEQKARVCLLDLDVQWGTIGLYLDLQPMRSVVDLVQAGDRLDAAYLEALMLKHDSGIEVLPAPAHIVALDTLTPELVDRTFTFITHVYDYVVVDLPHAIVPWVSYVLGHSALIHLVVQLNVTSIRQAQRFLEVLREGDLAAVPLATVLNRYEKSLFGDGVRVKEAEKALRTKFDYTVSNDFKTAIAAQNQGVPLSRIARRNRIVKDVESMVGATVKRLTAAGEPAAQPHRLS